MHSKLLRNCLQQKPFRLLEWDVEWNENNILDFCNEIPNTKYKINILKHLLETGIQTEFLYETLGALYSEEFHQNKIIYVLPHSQAKIELVEENAVICKGTTGLSTWDASLFLLEYFYDNDFKFNGLALELGSGVGLLCIALKVMGWNIIASDGNELVIERLQQNIKLNKQNIEILDLDWENCDIEIAVDMIIGADIVFNPVLVVPLVSVIQKILEYSKQKGRDPYCIIAFTERTKETHDLFIKRVNESLNCQELVGGHKQWFYYKESTPIFIFKITLKYNN